MVVNVTGYIICMGIGCFLCLIFERSGFSASEAIFYPEEAAEPEDPEEASDPEDPEDSPPDL